MRGVALPGCDATTLGGYLAGLGVLRLVAGQREPAACGHWRGGVFVLTSSLEAGELAEWLVSEYAPSPIVSPWNAGSGFAATGKSVSAERALAALRDSGSPRLAGLRAAILAAEDVVAEARSRGWSGPAREWLKDRKTDLLALCRNRLPDDAVAWLDVAVALTSGGEVHYNPLTGTGGNLGRQDLSATFLQRLATLIGPGADDRRCRMWARAALTGAEDVPYTREAVGQYDPGRAGGIHSSAREKADDQGFANPWSYVLALEGTLAFASAVARRGGEARASVPFLFAASPVGHGSAAEGESPKGELWAPLWPAPARLGEVEHLLGEGRSTWRGRQARTGLDAALAAASLGVDRGVTGFQRFTIAERLGQSPLAVFTGRVTAAPRREVALLAAPDEWMSRVRRAEPPAGVRAALRRAEEAMWQVAAGGGAAALRRFVIEFGRLHETVGRSSRIRGQVLPYRPDRPDWPAVLGDGGPELQLAAGFASLRDRRPHGADRSLAALITRVRHDRAHGDRLVWADAPATGVDLTGATLAKALAEAHRRRFQLSEPAAQPFGRSDDQPGEMPRPPAKPRRAYEIGRWVPLGLVQDFVLDGTDDDLLAGYLSGLLALGCTAAGPSAGYSDAASAPLQPGIAALLPFFGTRALAVTRVGGRDDGMVIEFSRGPEPTWVARLIAGGLPGVAADVLLSLRLAGCPPIVSPTGLGQARLEGVRLAAALLLHVPPGRRAAALAAMCAVRPHYPPAAGARQAEGRTA